MNSKKFNKIVEKLCNAGHADKLRGAKPLAVMTKLGGALGGRVAGGGHVGYAPYPTQRVQVMPRQGVLRGGYRVGGTNVGMAMNVSPVQRAPPRFMGNNMGLALPPPFRVKQDG